MRDEILAMGPGPQIDAMVAHRVLGCRIVLSGSGDCPRILRWHCGCEHEEHTDYDYDHDSAPVLKRYGDDITAAWDVVETIREGGCSVMLVVVPDGAAVEAGEERAGCVARVDHPRLEDGWQAMADSIPLAICRVALLVTMKDT
jgi:hypothetical protein